MKLKIWKLLYGCAILASDILIIYFVFWLAYKIRFTYEPFLEMYPVIKGTPPWRLYQDALRILIPVWVLIMGGVGNLYQLRFSQSYDNFLAILKSVILSVLLIIALTFLFRRYEYSRLVILLAFVIAPFALFIAREFWMRLAHFIYDSVAIQEKIILIAQGKPADAIEQQIRRNPHHELVRSSGKNLAELSALVKADESISEVIVQGQFLKDPATENFLELCEDLDIEIKILPEFLEMRMGEIHVDDSLGVPVLHLKPLSLHGYRFFIKRFFDVSLSILVISLLFFPLLLICLLIVIDSRGGIFFYQERVGYKEKLFRCLKFRTMHKNAEQLLQKMNLESFRGGPAFKMKNDPRITRVGKILRKFSLDELPQIWNVLRGEMSLIGPRPQVLKEAQGNLDWARKRYRILPGITGLWQVSGRADLSYEDMMRLDIYYLENWSPGLDLKIVLKTIPVVISSKGAY